MTIKIGTRGLFNYHAAVVGSVLPESSCVHLASNTSWVDGLFLQHVIKHVSVVSSLDYGSMMITVSFGRYHLLLHTVCNRLISLVSYVGVLNWVGCDGAYTSGVHVSCAKEVQVVLQMKIAWILNILRRQSLGVQLHPVRLSTGVVQVKILTDGWSIAKNSIVSLVNRLVTLSWSSMSVLDTWIAVVIFAWSLRYQLPSKPHGVSVASNSLLLSRVPLRIIRARIGMVALRLSKLLLIDGIHVLLLCHFVCKFICLVQLVVGAHLLPSLVLRICYWTNVAHVLLLLSKVLPIWTHCAVLMKSFPIGALLLDGIGGWKMIKLHWH